MPGFVIDDEPWWLLPERADVYLPFPFSSGYPLTRVLQTDASANRWTTTHGGIPARGWRHGHRHVNRRAGRPAGSECLRVGSLVAWPCAGKPGDKQVPTVSEEYGGICRPWLTRG